jgi:hypothetical protein
MMRLVAGAVVAGALAVGMPAGPSAARPSPAPPGVGSTITTRRVRVTLRAYRQPVTVRTPIETTTAGTGIAAVDVEACSTAAGPVTVGPYQFFLEPPDRHLVFPAKAIDTPRPQFHATTLTARHCARGWLSYELPAGTRAAYVVFQAGAMFTNTFYKWTVPPSASR